MGDFSYKEILERDLIYHQIKAAILEIVVSYGTFLFVAEAR